MMRKIATTMITCMAVLFSGAIAQEAKAVEAITTTDVVKTVYKVDGLVRIADNVVIMFDSSGSMAEPFGVSGMTKLQAAKKFLKQRTDAFPKEYSDLNVGLYLYTPPTNTIANAESAEIHKVQPFNKAEFYAAVDRLPEEASGPTLMVNGLRRLDHVIDTLSGRTVVFFFIDGTHSDAGATEGPVDIAQKIAQKHNVDFKIISTTSMTKNIELMEQVASINRGSTVTPLEWVIDRQELFMGAIFALEENYVIAATTRDKIVGFKLEHIQFGFDKDDIDIDFAMELDTVGEILNQNPKSYLVLAGHTDNIGSEEYNLTLSQKRVEAVAEYLAKQFNLDSSRIVTFSYGEAAPVASNDNDEGRQMNRRVVGFISGIN